LKASISRGVTYGYLEYGKIYPIAQPQGVASTLLEEIVIVFRLMRGRRPAILDLSLSKYP